MGVRLIKYNRNTTNTQDGVIFNDHDELYNRDLKNQHPIYAITGLQEVLNVLEDNITETNRLLIEKDKATNARIDAILLDIEAIQKDIEKEYGGIFGTSARDRRNIKRDTNRIVGEKYGNKTVKDLSAHNTTVGLAIASGLLAANLAVTLSWIMDKSYE